MVNSEKMEQLTDDAIMHIFPRLPQLAQWQLSRTCIRLRALYLYYKTTIHMCIRRLCPNLMRKSQLAYCARERHFVCLTELAPLTTEDFNSCAFGAVIGGHLDILIIALCPAKSSAMARRFDCGAIAFNIVVISELIKEAYKYGHNHIISYLDDILERIMNTVMDKEDEDNAPKSGAN